MPTTKGDSTTARRCYQRGNLRKRGKRDPAWVLQWRNSYKQSDGSIGREWAQWIVGRVAEMTYREARKATDAQLLPLNAGNVRPESAITVAESLIGTFIPLGFSRVDSLLFPSATGNPLSDTKLLHRHLKAAGKRLGLPWRNWHPMRCTFVALFQSHGGSLREAQAQLGHSRMSRTLEVYTLLPADSQRAAVELLSSVLSSAIEAGGG